MKNSNPVLLLMNPGTAEHDPWRSQYWLQRQANWLTGLKLRLRKKWHNLPGLKLQLTLISSAWVDSGG